MICFARHRAMLRPQQQNSLAGLFQYQCQTKFTWCSYECRTQFQTVTTPTLIAQNTLKHGAAGSEPNETALIAVQRRAADWGFSATSAVSFGSEPNFDVNESHIKGASRFIQQQ